MSEYAIREWQHPPVKRRKLDERKLQEYFNFDEEDLGANRMGLLSEKQLKHLYAGRKPVAGRDLGIGVLLFLIGGVGIFASVSAVLHAPGMLERIIFVLIFGILWPYFFGKLGLQMLDASRPKRNTRVKTKRGKLQVSRREAPGIIPYYELHIGNRRVEVESDLAGMVVEGDQYAMYYLEKTRGILSLERLSKTE